MLAQEIEGLDFAGFDIDWQLPSDNIDWADVDDLSEETYDEPKHTMLECPACHHVDRDIHFKKIQE